MLLTMLKAAIVHFDFPQITPLTQAALVKGIAPQTILQQSLVAAMTQVGEKFAKQEYFLPELLTAAEAMAEALAILQPHLTQSEHAITRGTIVLGTARGDLHDIGKNIVKIMFTAANFQVIDLGYDVAPERFVEAVREHQAGWMGISALLTTTMLQMPEVIKAISQSGLRRQVTILVGGAPVTAEYAREIGADIYAADASQAVTQVRQRLEAKP